jgi:hypothetical protein
MKRVGMLLAAAVLVLTMGAKCEGSPGKAPTPTSKVTCEEDQSWCWDCKTMGNHKCGPGEVKS